MFRLVSPKRGCQDAVRPTASLRRQCRQPFPRSLAQTTALFSERTTEGEPLYAYDPLSFTPSGKAIPIRIVRSAFGGRDGAVAT